MSSRLKTVISKVGFWAKTHKIWTLVCALIVVVGVGTSVYQGIMNRPQKEVVLTPEFEEEQTREVQESGVQAGIKIPGYSKIVIEEGQTEVDVDFFNPEENTVYFQITLQLTDDGTVLYESKFMEPGQHLYKITLLEQVEQGEYDMTIVYKTYSMDENYAPKNGASVNCILEVK